MDDPSNGRWARPLGRPQSFSDGHSDGFRTRLPILLALAAAADCAVSCGDALLPSTSAWARRVDSGVMLDAAYTISRYERMVIIAIGAICAHRCLIFNHISGVGLVKSQGNLRFQNLYFKSQGHLSLV